MIEIPDGIEGGMCICPKVSCEAKDCNHYGVHELNEGCMNSGIDDEPCPSCLMSDFINKSEMYI